MLKIYKASAGSGKTYTLAYEYIRSLLGVKNKDKGVYCLNSPRYNHGLGERSNRHRYILAITFTNKATEEMKRRIIDELDALSRMPRMVDGKLVDANYAKALCQELNCSRAELAEVADRALKQLLYDYGQFQVTTIDSFFQRVLRTFARELDRQGDFNVELNDKTAVQTAVNAMLDEFNTDPTRLPQLADWIFEYMCGRLDEGSKTNFFNRSSLLHKQLVSLVATISEEAFKPYDAKMRQRLANPADILDVKKSLIERRKTLLDEIKQQTLAMLKRIGDDGYNLDGMKKGSKVRKLVEEYLAKGQKWEAFDVLVSEKGTGYKMIMGISPAFNKGANVPQYITDIFVDYLSRMQTLVADHSILDDIIRAVDHLVLLSYAWSYLSEFVATNNVVLLSDTNYLLRRIIGDQDDAPFIYERIGSQLRHFLIDEFQDTSRMQWENLKPLVANGMAESEDSLIIGDEKQSIYRFRNSDSSLLHTEVADLDFPSSRYDTKVHGANPGENTNYRSATQVVRFNNSLFQRLGSEVEGYENVVQDIPKDNFDVSGYVKFTAVPTAKEFKAIDPEGDVTEHTLELMAQNMLRQHSQGNYRWSDITVLVNTNLEGASVVDFLVTKHPEIPVLSDESLYVRRSQAVQMVVGALESMVNDVVDSGPGTPGKPRYHTAAEVALTVSRFNCLHNQGIDAYDALNRSMPGASGTGHQPESGGEPDNTESQPVTLSIGVDAVRQRKPSSLPALVEALIQVMVPESQRVQQMTYLNAFQDYVMDYCSRNIPSVTAFLEQWNIDKAKLAVAAAADVNAVRVMTIHKSKGLEFDCVHIPFGSWAAEDRARRMWVDWPEVEGVDPDKAPPAIAIKLEKVHSVPGTYFYQTYLKDQRLRAIDTLNKTYVAYTRAARELMVYYEPRTGIGSLVTQAFAGTVDLHDSDLRLCDLAEYFDPESCCFEYGAPTERIVKPKKGDAPEVKVMDSYNIYTHEGVKVLTTVEDALDLDLDITDDPDAETRRQDDYDPEARERGVVLHNILAQVIVESDIDRAVNSAAVRHGLDADGRAYFKSFVSEMLAGAPSYARRWWAPDAQVLTEQTIYLPEGWSVADGTGDGSHSMSNASNRRPDRIVINADGTVDVVDYKFTSRMLPKHEDQVRMYASILNTMGYQRVRGHLWYPFMQKVVTVL